MLARCQFSIFHAVMKSFTVVVYNACGEVTIHTLYAYVASNYVQTLCAPLIVDGRQIATLLSYYIVDYLY